MSLENKLIYLNIFVLIINKMSNYFESDNIIIDNATNQVQYLINIGKIIFPGLTGPTGVIAIGYLAGQTNQSQNSIILNASNTSALNATYAGTFINPIRVATSTSFASTPSILLYDSARNELGYSALPTTQNKTFIIDHPNYENKYLVHACLEGPEAGIYYRGKGEIVNNESVQISLPDYVDKISSNLTVQLTPIYDGKFSSYWTSEVISGKFTVYGKNGRFFWTVFGTRENIEVEPEKNLVCVKGDGPYKWV